MGLPDWLAFVIVVVLVAANGVVWWAALTEHKRG
ncbi:MAG: hypothetical protein K0S99_133 [Thermomicrobiales bacterium]|jgi:hypothetical protein|nr:hypothetical protein [Thermomicrobiales bacterium]